MAEHVRWSDDELEKFHAEFREYATKFSEHARHEEIDSRQQKELHELIFRTEDSETGKPPGLLQLTTRLSKQLHEIQVWQDRQRTFIGGIAFTLTAIWFFVTDVGHTLFKLLKSL